MGNLCCFSAIKREEKKRQKAEMEMDGGIEIQYVHYRNGAELTKLLIALIIHCRYICIFYERF
jgi:hypothetical protein